jgi:TRAP-type mannitol/chloroaromatic compound transport system permease small subunit
MLRELARQIDRFQDVLGRALSWLMLAMVLTVFFDVVSRYLLARTYVFTQELEWYIFAVAYLMAGGYVMLWDEHVRVDIMYSRMSPRKRAWVDFVLLFVFFFPSALLVIYTTWPFFRNAWTVYEGSPDPGGIPARWALKGVIIVAFSTMVIQGVSEAIKRFYWAMGWEQPEVRARELR